MSSQRSAFNGGLRRSITGSAMPAVPAGRNRAVRYM